MVLLLGTSQKGLSPMKTTHVYINPCLTSCLSDVGLCLHPNKPPLKPRTTTFYTPLQQKQPTPFPYRRSHFNTLYGTRLPEITIRKTFDTGSNRAHLSSSRPIPSALIPLLGTTGNLPHTHIFTLVRYCPLWA